MFLGVVALVTLHYSRSSSLALTSDPACYLNYAKTLASGHLCFRYPAADVAFGLGGRFPASVLHGYVFASPAGQLYAFVGIGFPLWLAGIIRVLGLPAATVANVALLPLFLMLYGLVLRRTRAHSTAWSQWAVPVGSVAWLFCGFESFLASWVLPYRELLAMALALAALLPAARHPQRHPWSWAAAAGLLMGVAGIVRETALFMLPSLALLFMAGITGPWRRRLPRQLAMAALIAGMAAAGYAPQLAINVIQRGTLAGKQAEKTLAFLRHQGPPQNTAPGKALLPPTNRDTWAKPGLGRVLVDRARYVRKAGGLLLLLAAASGLACVRFRREDRFLFVTLVPAAAYFVANSLLIPATRGYAERYELAVFLFLVPLAARGIVELAEWLRPERRHAGLTRLVDGLLVAALLGLLLARSLPMLRTPSQGATLRGLAAFQHELDRHIPEGAIVFADAPSRDYLQYLSRGNAVGLYSLIEATARPAGEIVAACLCPPHRVFFFDAPNLLLPTNPYSAAETERRLRAEADLVPLHRFHLADFDLAGEFKAAEATLYELVPATNTVRTCELPAPFAGPARLELDAGTRPPGSSVTLKIDEALLPSSLQGPRRLVASFAATSTVLRINVAASAPLPPLRDIRIVPMAAATLVPFGRDGAELDVLGPGWISKLPNLHPGARQLPGRSTLHVGTLGAGPMDVYLGIYPVRASKVCLTVRRGGTPLQPTLCLDRNERVVGLLVRDWPATDPLTIENASKAPILIHALAAGTRLDALALPLRPAGSPALFWRAALVPEAAPSAAREVLIPQVSAGMPTPTLDVPGITLAMDAQAGLQVHAATGSRLLLLAPLDVPWHWTVPDASDDVARDAMAESWLCAGGFYGIEAGGTWTRGEARILLPPDAWQHPLDVALALADPRPPRAPPTRVTLSAGGATICEAEVPRQAGVHRLRARVPMQSPAQGLPTLLLSSPVWTPSHAMPGNGDGRDLGLQLRAVDVEVARP